jgi:outer membrane lipoprotein
MTISNNLKAHKMKIFAIFMVGLFSTGMLVGCATQMPVPIREKIATNPTIQEVAHNVDAYKGQRVRWGGMIQNVENRKSETIIEIVGRDLDKSGRPIESDKSTGRFLANKSGFLDPAIYAKGRSLTVVGTIETGVKRDIGEFSYFYPEVKVDTYYLWEKIQPRYVDPYWYDPWYPWYPYGYPWWWRPYY